MAGPQVEDEAGKISFEAGRSLPTLGNEFLQHSTLAFGFRKAPGRRSLTSRAGITCLPVRWKRFSAPACWCDQKLSQIGGFDEKFFLYSEELDLCHRFRGDGWQIWYVHTAKLLHKERQSTIQLFGL